MKLHYQPILTLLLASVLAGFSACDRPAAPTPVYPVPTAAQLQWHQLENYAFIHFGLNTYNDLEWGYGNTPLSTFAPEVLDCDQWVSTIQAAGLKGVILTAKHHDGFCLWPTATTDYNISNTPYKGGQGDLVKELSEACHRAGLKFGLYLSPWDRNNAEYGREAYRKTYHDQIRELISDYGPLFEFWFDGANGGNGWYGGADEVRSITPSTYYGYEEAREMIKAQHPDAMIFGGTVPDIRWVGNESGWAGATNWAMYDEARASHYTQSQWGMEDAQEWLPGECDVSIRPGWFYHHREDHQVKSVPEIIGLYYKTVGHNANFLLNFPVALDGKIAATDSTNAVEAHLALQREFKEDLLAGLKPEGSAERGRRFSAAKVTDGDWDTYWSTPEGADTGSLTFRFPETTVLNRLLIQEYIPLGQRVRAFTVEVATPEGWQPVEATDSLTTVGYKRLVRFRTVSTDALKITFTDARGPLCINTVQAFHAPRLLELPEIRRDAEGQVTIRTIDASDIYYTTDPEASPDQLKSGTSWKLYDGTFLMDDRGTVKALCYDPETGLTGPVALRSFDLPARHYATALPSTAGTEALFDDNGRTVYRLTGSTISLAQDQERKICGFIYVPDQRRDASGHISAYRCLVDGQQVAAGEFPNIRNNPIPQTVNFKAVRGKILTLEVTRTLTPGRADIGDLFLLTLPD